MVRRPPVLLACLTYALLGLVVGLIDFRQRAAFPIGRYSELLKFPHPLSVQWIGGLRGPADALEAFERPLAAGLVVLLLAAFALLAMLLNPRFRVLKPPAENVGRGFGSHVDVPLLLRAVPAALLSMWLLGLFAPLVAALAAGSPRWLPLFMAMGGLPVWTASLPATAAPVVHGLLLGPALWMIWGPGGMVSRAKDDRPLRTLQWGLLAGVALVPGLLAMHQGRFWIAEAAPAFSLADRAGWQTLLGWTVLLPVLAATYFAVIAAAFQPRPARAMEFRLAAVAAVTAAFIAASAQVMGQAWLADLDLDGKPFRQVMKVPASNMRRAAVILLPRGRAGLSITDDGTTDYPGAECVSCWAYPNVERYLEAKHWRSGLVFRSYVHLHDCFALAWDPQRCLDVNLRMCERAPSPIACRLLQERL
ncbi:MAG TPA: hypothetical protein VFU47_13560, partial [Armatimonadota bacterium]|nr:hypothetical protein [Armatimonadota bacterium]